VTFAASSRHVLVSVLRTGSTISHYKLLEKLGEGGMGVVFKARDKRLKRLVALKFIVSDGVGTPEHERRLLQEARTASSFRHPNIAHIYEVNKAPLTDVDHTVGIFIAMEYVPGKLCPRSFPNIVSTCTTSSPSQYRQRMPWPQLIVRA